VPKHITAALQAKVLPAWPQLRPHPKQRAAFLSKARLLALPCGRISGKTEISRRKLVMSLALKKPWPDPRYFFAGPTHQQAKRVAWRPLLSLIPKAWIETVSYSELVVYTVFGSELHVVGLDRPQRIEGTLWDGGVIDESCDVRPGSFDLSILPALMVRNGWCWRIGVPKRFGIGAAEYKEFCDQCERGDLGPDAEVYAWPSSEIVPKEALDFARAKMDAKDFDEQFNASWLTSSGGIFHAWSDAHNIRPCSYNPQKPIIVGQDFNVDPMAWVCCHEYREAGDSWLEVFDELWLRNTNTPEALDALFSRYRTHKASFEFIGCQSSNARQTSAEVTDVVHISNHDGFRSAGRKINLFTKNPPIHDRFSTTNALICNALSQRRLFVDSRCKHLIQDLNSRAYKPGTRDVADVGDAGHITDALGYVIFKKFPIQLAAISNARRDIALRPSVVPSVLGL
jgi:hypothetical protein